MSSDAPFPSVITGAGHPEGVKDERGAEPLLTSRRTRCRRAAQRSLAFRAGVFALIVFATIVAFFARGEPPKLTAGMTPPPRARVVIIQDADATQNFRPLFRTVRSMVDKGIVKFTGRSTPASAWQSIVSATDVVGIKVYSAPGSQVGTRVAVVDAVIESLLESGLQPTNIIIWDRRLSDLRRAGFDSLERKHRIQLAGSIESGWDTNAFYESAFLGQLVFGDHEFRKDGQGNVGRRSYVSALVTKRITKVINISPLLNHNSAGVCGNLYGMAMGSIDNSLRFEGDSTKLAVSVPEIYALPQLYDRIAIHIVDALVCQYQGEQIGHLHYSAALNELRFSHDAVALDALSIDELLRQRAAVQATQFPQTNGMHLIRNAEILELGVGDRSRIDVERHAEVEQRAEHPARAVLPAE